MATREEAFDQHVPTFTARQAQRAFEAFGGEVVSVAAKRGAPDYVMVAFATAAEGRRLGPIALNPVVVEKLRYLLDQLAFSQ